MSIFPGGGSVPLSFISKNGQTVTLTSETRTVDTSSDWDDETYTTTTVTATALVTRTRSRGELAGSETGTETNADFVVWLNANVLDDITLRDSSGSNPPSTVTFNGHEFEVVWVDDSITNIVRLEVAR